MAVPQCLQGCAIRSARTSSNMHIFYKPVCSNAFLINICIITDLTLMSSYIGAEH